MCSAFSCYILHKHVHTFQQMDVDMHACDDIPLDINMCVKKLYPESVEFIRRAASICYCRLIHIKL